MNSEKSTILECITPIYRFANILALVPPLNNTKKSKYKLYNIFVSIVITVCIGGCFLFEEYWSFEDQNSVLMFFSATTMLTLLLSINLAIVRTTLTTVRDKYYALNNILIEIDATLTTKRSCKRRFYIEVVCTHLFLMALFIYEGQNWIREIGIDLYIVYICHELGHYYLIIMVLLMYNYVKAIQYCCVATNKNLQICLSIPNPVVNDYSIAIEQIKRSRKIYLKITAFIETFNSLFGWTILFMVAFILLGILDTINYIIVATMDKKFVADVAIGIEFILIECLWCILLMITGTSIAGACDTTTNEAQRTAQICDVLLVDIPAACTQDERLVKEELILLSQQATHRYPYFTAAGFLTVNYKMLLGILGTVTSYTIVLIQINK